MRVLRRHSVGLFSVITSMLAVAAPARAQDAAPSATPPAVAAPSAPLPPAPPPPAPSDTAAPPPQAPPPQAPAIDGIPAIAATADAPAPASDAWGAGYRQGAFYVRSPNDVFRLYLQGRVHADWTDQFGPGTSALSPDTALKSGFYLRRARLEIGGELYQQWQWQIGAEFAAGNSVDNPGATSATRACSVDPTTSALSCSDREASVESPQVKAIPTDVFVNYGPLPWTNIEVGQFYLPFTLENRISDNTTAFLERSLPVRNIGAPLQRDIGAMFWGESPDKLIYYAVALLNGDGPNRPNADSRYDVAGRVVVRPLANTSGSSKLASFGVSARGGSRDAGYVGYDMPSLTTQEGFAFWKPTYKDSLSRTLHILPSGSQYALAADVYVPIDGFDFTSELIYTSTNTREAVDGLQLSPFTERTGTFKGYGWYAQLGYWIFGDHDIIGHPSYGKPVHIDLSKPQAPPKQGLQVLAKVEQLRLSYASAARGGKPDSKTPDGDIAVDSVEFGVNYWATKHLRVGVNYSLYSFPDSAPVSASAAGSPAQNQYQRASAPGNLLAKGVDPTARDSAHTLNEISLRVGVQF